MNTEAVVARLSVAIARGHTTATVATVDLKAIVVAYTKLRAVVQDVLDRDPAGPYGYNDNEMLHWTQGKDEMLDIIKDQLKEGL